MTLPARDTKPHTQERMLVKNVPFPFASNLAQQALCGCTNDDLSPTCQEVIRVVQNLARVISHNDYDTAEVAELMEKLRALGVPEQKVHTFFAARFVVGRGMKPNKAIQPEIQVLERVGIPSERITRLVKSGDTVAAYCAKNNIAPDQVVATLIVEGEDLEALILPIH